ncbi:MAG: hypothetical protein WCI21_09750 [Alphaproteobacteria bacterium]
MLNAPSSIQGAAARNREASRLFLHSTNPATKYSATETAPATIAARIDQYARIGVDCLMLRFLPAFEGMDRFARDVMPLLRVKGALAPA